MATADVLVVGGGIIGASTAFTLARAGASVQLVERDQIGHHASRASAGMLAPLAESLGREPQCGLGWTALDLMPAFVEEVRALSGIDPELVQCGILRAATAAEVETLQRLALGSAEHGCRWLEGAALREMEPGLGPGFHGAIWSPREGRVDAFTLTRACAAAAANHGAKLALASEVIELVFDGERVTGARTRDRLFSAGEVVLCTGAWAGQAGRWAPLALEVEPVRGQMLALDSPGGGRRFVVWGADSYVVPGRDEVRVGATVERVGFEARTTAMGVKRLLDGALRLLPELGERSLRRTWAGLRPATSDRLPLVGPAPGIEGLSLAVGHDRSGILLSGLTALAIADWVLARKRGPELEAWSPDRRRAAPVERG